MEILIKPEAVDTASQWFGVCGKIEAEESCRAYAQTAQKHDTWALTQQQLNNSDYKSSFLPNDTFQFNGTVEAGLFHFTEDKWWPTDKYFRLLIMHDKVPGIQWRF